MRDNCSCSHHYGVQTISDYLCVFITCDKLFWYEGMRRRLLLCHDEQKTSSVLASPERIYVSMYLQNSESPRLCNLFSLVSIYPRINLIYKNDIFVAFIQIQAEVKRYCTNFTNNKQHTHRPTDSHRPQPTDNN